MFDFWELDCEDLAPPVVRVEVEHYVERDAVMDSWERIQIGLPVLGMIHTILRDVEVSAEAKFPVFANYIEPHQALNKTLQGTRRVRGWNCSLAEQRLADAANWLTLSLRLKGTSLCASRDNLSTEISGITTCFSVVGMWHWLPTLTLWGSVPELTT